MRVHRSVQILTIVTTLAACSSGSATPSGQPDATVAAAPAAAPIAAPVATPEPAPAPTLAINVRWDSGPLDREYYRARVDMDARHTREIAGRQANESADQRGRRHEAENKTLEQRYARGKASHSRTLPGADR